MTDNREIILAKLGSQAELVSEDLLEMCIDEISIKIKEYCNISVIPDTLKYTHANMTVELINHEIAGTGTSSSGDLGSVGDVTDVTLGDMKLSFGSSNGTNVDALSTIIMNYADSLNKYRRAVWK